MFTDATFCNEYERWLDKLAQNAPEGVQMEQIDYADTLTTAIQNAGGGYVYYPSYGVPDEAVNKFVASGLLKRGDGDSVTAGENFYTAASEPELWETYPPGWDTVEDEPEINPQTGWVRKTEAERVTFNANMADMLIGRIAALLNIDGKFAVDYGTSQIEDAIKAQAAEIERLKAEIELERQLKRANAHRASETTDAFVQRIGRLQDENSTLKAKISAALGDFEAIATGMTGDYSPESIANIAIAKLTTDK